MSSRRFSYDSSTLKITGRQLGIVGVLKGDNLYIQDNGAIRKCKTLSEHELYRYVGHINAKVKRYHGAAGDMALPPIKPKSVMTVGKQDLMDGIIKWNRVSGYFNCETPAGQEVEKWLDSSGIEYTLPAIESGEYLKPYLRELQLTELRGLYVMTSMNKKSLIELLKKWFREYQLLFLEKQKL